jgi:protein-tyrosine phosphatase
MGVLLQCNIDSILGNYGNNAKKTLKYILKNKLVSFVGTDIHSIKTDYSYIEKAKKKFQKYLTDEELDNIFNKNALEIINRV